MLKYQTPTFEFCALLAFWVWNKHCDVMWMKVTGKERFYMRFHTEYTALRVSQILPESVCSRWNLDSDGKNYANHFLFGFYHFMGWCRWRKQDNFHSIKIKKNIKQWEYMTNIFELENWANKKNFWRGPIKLNHVSLYNYGDPYSGGSQIFLIFYH